MELLSKVLDIDSLVGDIQTNLERAHAMCDILQRAFTSDSATDEEYLRIESAIALEYLFHAQEDVKELIPVVDSVYHMAKELNEAGVEEWMDTGSEEDTESDVGAWNYKDMALSGKTYLAVKKKWQNPDKPFCSPEDADIFYSLGMAHAMKKEKAEQSANRQGK